MRIFVPLTRFQKSIPRLPFEDHSSIFTFKLFESFPYSNI